jgi:hypothetical protein
MTFIRKMAGAASLFAVAALMVASFAASSANAQPANPMQVFGLTGSGDVAAGDTIGAWIGGVQIGTATADANGWVIDIQNGTNGDTVAFSINGDLAAETVTYEGFGAAEVTLTAAADAPAAPTPAETGNAGLMGSTGTSMMLVLALGVFAAALVAGGRTATRRS